MPGHTFYWDPVNFFPGVFDGHLTMFVSANGVLYGTFRPKAAPSARSTPVPG